MVSGTFFVMGEALEVSGKVIVSASKCGLRKQSSEHLLKANHTRRKLEARIYPRHAIFLNNANNKKPAMIVGSKDC